MRIGYIQAKHFFDPSYCLQEKWFIVCHCDKIIAEQSESWKALINTLVTSNPNDQIFLCLSNKLLSLLLEQDIKSLAHDGQIELVAID